jgi:RNA recognition motif-containing protein
MLTLVLLSHLHRLNYDFLITVTREEFRLYFEQFGAVFDSVIMFDRETQRSRGFGFVTFEDPESAARVLSMGTEQNVQQQDSNTNNDPPVARLEMRGKKIEAKAAEPKGQRRYDGNHGHSRERPPFPSPMKPNTMTMMMYGPNDPNLYYSNALGHYYAPHSFAPPPFIGYMAPMYYPEQVPQYYPPVIPMVEGYYQHPPMDAAYGYASVPFATPHIYEQPYGTTSVMQPMAPDIPVKEGGVEVEGSTA